MNGEAGTGKLKVHVVVIPLGRDQLIPALLDGHADLIAGDLTITEDRSDLVAFARPLLDKVNEVIVTGPGMAELSSIDDLSGRQVVVRASSSYFEHLQTLVADFESRGLESPQIVEADEILEAEDLLEMVNNGMIPMTVMDDYKAEFWKSVFPDITIRNDLVINTGGSIAWAMRPDNPELASMVDDFLAKYGKGTMIGNDTYNRYLADAESIRCSHGPKAIENLQALVGIFQKYGEEYDFDWLMLAAQGFQESGLQQDRRSPAGAIGIMQIKPSTAKDPNVAIVTSTPLTGTFTLGPSTCVSSPTGISRSTTMKKWTGGCSAWPPTMPARRASHSFGKRRVPVATIPTSGSTTSKSSLRAALAPRPLPM